MSRMSNEQLVALVARRTIVDLIAEREALRDALAAYQTKVRERAINRDDENHQPPDGPLAFCLLCSGWWRTQDPERHELIDCPAKQEVRHAR